METMSDPEEARIAITAAREATRLDVACTFTFTRTLAGEYRTIMGTGIGEYLDMARTAGADIVEL